MNKHRLLLAELAASLTEASFALEQQPDTIGFELLINIKISLRKYELNKINLAIVHQLARKSLPELVESSIRF